MIPKYARLEIERRFLVDRARAPDLRPLPFSLIEDLYIDGGRLRLRTLTDSRTGAKTFKLGKKYTGGDPMAAPITNLYLTQGEHAAFAGLPGAPLSKVRHRLEQASVAFSVDVFLGELQGLVLCETEAATREAALALKAPPWAAREVTDDPFFTGGNLCRVSAAELKARLQL
jgi:CYTH domain-containing protein